MGLSLCIDVVSQFANQDQMPMAINKRIGDLQFKPRHVPINQYVEKLATCDSDLVLLQDLPDAAVESVFRKMPATFCSHFERRNVSTSSASGEHELLAALTPRQREVLAFIAKGFTLKETARLMNLSPKSIDSHMHRVRGRLGIHDRVHLALFAVRVGLIDP